MTAVKLTSDSDQWLESVTESGIKMKEKVVLCEGNNLPVGVFVRVFTESLALDLKPYQKVEWS